MLLLRQRCLSRQRCREETRPHCDLCISQSRQHEGRNGSRLVVTHSSSRLTSALAELLHRISAVNVWADYSTDGMEKNDGAGDFKTKLSVPNLRRYVDWLAFRASCALANLAGSPSASSSNFPPASIQQTKCEALPDAAHSQRWNLREITVANLRVCIRTTEAMFFPCATTLPPKWQCFKLN